MAVSVSILSWNIQILGQTKADRNLATDLLAMIIAQSGADIVVVEELVFNYGDEVFTRLVAGLRQMNQNDWDGTFIQALPNGSDRDGYLFLWRSAYKQQVIGGKKVQDVFTGDWPLNWSTRNGRRPGYVGLTLADGTHPFIVVGYHAPVRDNMSGSAPATALDALAKQGAHILTYSDGGAKNYEARFFCADFNLDINDASNFAQYYLPAMTTTKTTNVTVANTELMSINSVPVPPPTNSAAYIVKNVDNILVGPFANLINARVINIIDQIADKDIVRVIESFFYTNNVKWWWEPKIAYSRFLFTRTYISDHLPVQANFTVVP